MLGYFKKFNKQIWPYYSLIFDWNKTIIISTFKIINKKNTKYIIFVTTNIYSIDVNNLDIKLVIQ